MTPPDTLTAAQFQALCELLWGDHWRPAAADALGVSLRNVQFWAAEPPARCKAVPPGVIRELCEKARRLAEFDHGIVRAHVTRRLDQLWILELVTARETADHPAGH